MGKGADPNWKGWNGATALHFASIIGYKGVVDMILASGKITDINQGDDVGATALMRACMRGHAEVVAALLSAGADPSVISTMGTAAQWVGGKGKTEVVALLQAAQLTAGDLQVVTSGDIAAVKTIIKNKKKSPAVYAALMSATTDVRSFFRVDCRG